MSTYSFETEMTSENNDLLTPFFFFASLIWSLEVATKEPFNNGPSLQLHYDSMIILLYLYWNEIKLKVSTRK